ncbi:MAG: NAD-dependent epimerase/dehydratase family protein [Acidobacteria bacterium ACB1]|nr:Bifunctional polymyxin resistance protein ArnA [Pyrinomonadaceae bacterium]MCE7963464.1 NAD-dependent epimerase/dehydratase family protein [Acidobacteria bacterium ACB1]RIJ94302.1 MAG: nucleoside-diphosphate sugar epimerase [Acidobacteriota bacterium]
MKTLITGGAGFIGSHLADKLLAEGNEVTVIDDLSTGRYANVAHLEDKPGFRLLIDTVLNAKLMENLIRDTDRVYHMASAVGVRLIMERPVQTIETIFRGTDVVLGFCSRYRKRVLVPSTSEVYGKGVSVPFREEDDLLTGATDKHRWAYACAKTLDEFLALAHWKETQLPVVVVRLFNTVGPRQTGQYGMVVPRFVQAALKNEPISVYGDGEQRRCFGHVADVVGGLTQLLDNPSCFGEVINLGNNEEISINGLAKRAIELTASTSEIRHLTYDEVFGAGFEDMARRVPSLEKAERLIGYKPTRTLDDIINDVAAEFRRERPDSSQNAKA